MPLAGALALALIAAASAAPPSVGRDGQPDVTEFEALKEKLDEIPEDFFDQLGSAGNDIKEKILEGSGDLEKLEEIMAELANSGFEQINVGNGDSEWPAQRAANEGKTRRQASGDEGPTNSKGKGKEKSKKGSKTKTEDGTDTNGNDENSESESRSSESSEEKPTAQGRRARAAESSCKGDRKKSHEWSGQGDDGSSEMLPEYECASSLTDVTPFVCPMPEQVPDMINCEDDRPESGDEINCITGRTDGDALLEDVNALQKAAEEYWVAAKKVCETNSSRAIFKEGALLKHIKAEHPEFKCATNEAQPTPMCDEIPEPGNEEEAFLSMWDEVSNEDPYMVREYARLAACLTGIPRNTMMETIKDEAKMQKVTLAYWAAIRPSCE